MTRFRMRIRPVVALGLALTLSLSPLVAQAGEKEEIAALSTALAAAGAGDWDGAMAAAQGTSQAAADVIEWQRLRAAQGTLSDYEAFLARRPDWPGLPLLKEKGEGRLALVSDPARVIAYFGADLPRSAAGSIALVRAFDATGQADRAAAEALRGWVALKFTAEEETALLVLHPEIETKGNVARLDAVLWAGERATEAARMLPRVSAEHRLLAEARLALQDNAENAGDFVKAVPAGLAEDAGLAFDRFLWRMRRDLYPEAAQMILQRSASAESLGNPQAWAERRLTLARYLMRNGSPQDAYRVAASHHLASDADGFNDLEFLAGFIALRKLDDPGRALTHFQALPQQGTPITVSRRGYWMGRALEAMGRAEEARAAYGAAAGLQSAYYGLLAAEKLGLSLDPDLLSNAWPRADLDPAVAQSSVLAAAVALAKAGDGQLSGRFFVHLCETLSPAVMGQIAGLSMQMGEFRNALLIAKAAAEQGVIFPGAYYPVPDVVPYDLAVSRALALSIARRESEFDAKATSPAGALGLMQLMPETAKIEAKALGLGFDQGRLTQDPAYNVRLGSEHLKRLADRFGPSVALIAVGYNAGARRASDWISGFGDPRGGVDPVDWVETIPFNETRTYVMRVTESVVIYRAKLKGDPVKVRITSELTGQ